MPTPQDIMRHYDSDPDENPWVRGRPAPEPVRVAPYDPEWPALYARLAADIGAALGAALLRIDHVGSTAVPGLPAKPVVDIDVALADAAGRSDLCFTATGDTRPAMWVLDRVTLVPR